MGSSVTGIAIKVTDVFHANKLVRDAGEVTNSYVTSRAGSAPMAICIAISR